MMQISMQIRSFSKENRLQLNWEVSQIKVPSLLLDISQQEDMLLGFITF
jgi:hypothetical protein